MKVKLYILLILTIFNLNLFSSEKSYIDSLFNEIPLAKEDTNKVNLLIKLAKAQSTDKYYDRSTSIYINNALELSQKINYTKGLIQANDFLGVIHRNNAEYKKAIEYHQKSYEIAKSINDFLSMSTALNNIAVVYRRIDDFDKAIDFQLQSLQIIYRTNDKKSESFAMNSLGNIYLAIKEWDKAEKCFNSALEYQIATNNQRGLAINYANLGSVFEGRENYQKALDYYQKALEYNKTGKIDKGIAITYSNIGNIYLKMKLYEKALNYFDLSIKKSQALGDDYLNADNYYNFANVYYKLNKFQLSKEFIQKTLDISQSIKSKILMQNSYELLAKINFELKDYKAAYQAQIQVESYKDSIINEANQKNIITLQLKFDDQQKTSQIEFLKNEKAQQQTQLNYLYAMIALGLVVTALILYLSFLRIKANKKINSILTSKNLEIEKAVEALKEQNEITNIQKIELSRVLSDLKRSEEKYKAIFENSTIGLYRTTPDGRILMANKTLLKMLGYASFDELIEIDLKKENPYLDEERDKIIKKILDDGNLLGYESRWYKKDGSIIYVRESVTAIKDDLMNEYYLEGVIEDITESKLFEIALIESENRLKDALATKDKFFSIIAHDLKNPMQALILTSDLILHYFDKFTPEQLAEKINNINKSTKNLSLLLENLLQWARSQTGKIEFQLEINDIHNEIRQIITILEHSANTKNISINFNFCEISPFIFDKNMISTVLRNLISNAIKFTNNDGEINIETELVSINNLDYVQIKVKDNGIGIESYKIQNIFEIDSKYSERGTNNEIGTGLGLILCKEFVNKHFGEIWVESEYKKGSVFYFTIPLIQF